MCIGIMRNENELLFDCKNMFLGSFAENVTEMKVWELEKNVLFTHKSNFLLKNNRI